MIKIESIEKTVKTYSNGKVTIVTLTGNPSWDLDDLIWSSSKKIKDWVIKHPSVNTKSSYIKTIGKAVCSEEDENNPVLGERIAESRAKVSLYKFMTTLLRKICIYKSNELFGETPLSTIKGDVDKNSLIGQYIKYSNLCEKEKVHLNKLIK